MTSTPKHALTILLLTVAALSTFGTSQGGRQRVIEKWLSAPEKAEPVRMVSAEINDQRGGKKSVNFGEPFDDDDDWLKGLVLRVKNVSDKPITYIGVDLMVSTPTSEDPEHLVATLISYGRYPEEAKGQASEQKAVAPGEVIDLKLADGKYNHLKRLIESESGKPTYDKASLLLGDVLFADGNVYRSGRVKRYEPPDVQKISWRQGNESPGKPTGKALFRKISFVSAVESFFLPRHRRRSATTPRLLPEKPAPRTALTGRSVMPMIKVLSPMTKATTPSGTQQPPVTTLTVMAVTRLWRSHGMTLMFSGTARHTHAILHSARVIYLIA